MNSAVSLSFAGSSAAASLLFNEFDGRKVMLLAFLPSPFSLFFDYPFLMGEEVALTLTPRSGARRVRGTFSPPLLTSWS